MANNQTKQTAHVPICELGKLAYMPPTTPITHPSDHRRRRRPNPIRNIKMQPDAPKGIRHYENASTELFNLQAAP